ncbi:bifunctional phosphopantothenoylcysteine decarboxylase/phosphopantothenate--cysteine ligase CoaBC [Reinekea sp.]|jgi:phosphopantothenoylcysteine decarboxylase/phosphopantothenate--cysteine ligase|uniref:bifunctional phosphopantothenoylcysteine decarboxylase/phosphopantothenate--cysteine ligase CoaBC n=1 Tax=Reinekea sp. TaxID=1970455 RepID=UPI00398A4818
MTMPTDTLLANQLTGINVVVGVTGGIAAYKSAELVRLFIKRGAHVRVVMTEAAKAFITPLTFQALTGNPVSDALLDETAELGMGHIELARWASVVVIAPATADIIARLNAGMANDLLTTLCLATQAPIAIAPAMNEKMWHASVTQANLREIQTRISNLHIFGPAEGEQACGDIGAGRMLEAFDICQLTCALFSEDKPLKNKKVVITAGPTLEAIDPVRFLSNHSSGKMGYAIATAAANAGAEVILISGPVSLPTPAFVTRINVISALDMNKAAQAALNNCDAFIGTAAVADYRPANSAAQKLKKDQEGDKLSVSLVENPDIIAGVAQSEVRPKAIIAFAAETQDLENYARRKITKKGVDAVVANDVSRQDIGFGSDQNEIIWVTETQSKPYGPDSKANIAKHIIDHLTELLSSKA